jgi:predicted AAA+ superfamily ATPase
VSTLTDKISCLTEFFFADFSADGSPEYRAGRVCQLLRGIGRGSEPLWFNTAAREFPGSSLITALYGELFEAVIRFGVLPEDLANGSDNEKAEFLISRAGAFLEALKEYFAGSLDDDTILPGVVKELCDAIGDTTRDAVVNRLLESDRFAHDRVFRYLDGGLVAVKPDAVKPVDKFFGFGGVRHIYRDHFNDFRQGKCNVPLLIYSLPGYGKTSMTLSHALDIEKSVVILPEPEDLGGRWIELVSALSRRKDHLFVVFFDDIDPNAVDWYSFRTHVGGVFSMPENVLPVLSSNYEFPAGILSRGRKVSFPVFDEVRCTEMIEDFLLSFGLKNPPAQLISLIGADYTEEFGQKKFTELSPRTLMRYLQIYMNDRNKRRTMVEMSMGEMVTRPDAELFYEFNINLMRDLYGEEYITRLRNEKLKNL